HSLAGQPQASNPSGQCRHRLKSCWSQGPHHRAPKSLIVALLCARLEPRARGRWQPAAAHAAVETETRKLADPSRRRPGLVPPQQGAGGRSHGDQARRISPDVALVALGVLAGALVTAPDFGQCGFLHENEEVNYAVV